MENMWNPRPMIGLMSLIQWVVLSSVWCCITDLLSVTVSGHKYTYSFGIWTIGNFLDTLVLGTAIGRIWIKADNIYINLIRNVRLVNIVENKFSLIPNYICYNIHVSVLLIFFQLTVTSFCVHFCQISISGSRPPMRSLLVCQRVRSPRWRPLSILPKKPSKRGPNLQYCLVSRSCLDISSWLNEIWLVLVLALQCFH